jgi:hypothetical protein
MTFGFSVGTSLYSTVTPNGTTPGDSFSLSNHVLVTGSANLNRQIGRSWSGTVSYSRGLQYVQGFSGPFFSDSVSAGLSGYVNARGRLSLSAAYSSGQVHPVGTSQGYGTYSGQAGYQLAVGRYLAVSADYSYYHYLFDQAATLPVGMNQGVNRQSIRVGLNIWLPLLR